MIEMKVNLIENDNSLDIQNSLMPLSPTEEKAKLAIIDKVLETIEKFPELSTKNSINNNCVMNNFLIFNDAEYSAFTCLACNMENICQTCYEKCHAGHNLSNLKGSNQSKTVTIKNTSCNCAMNDHVNKGGQAELKRNYTNPNSLHDAVHCCPLNEIISLSNPVYNYFDDKIKMNICTFCTYYCMDNENYFPGKGLAKIKNGLGEKKTSCGCVKSDNHGTLEENITNIDNIMKDINLNIEINGVKLTYQLLTYKSFANKFFGGFLSNAEIVRSSLERGGPTVKEMSGVTKGNFNYDIVVQLLESMADRYSSKLILPKVLRKRENNQDVNLNENLPEDGPINTISYRSEFDSGPSFETYFNPEFLIKIFSLPERKGDVLFSFKLNCLKFYRKFVFLPMIKNRNFFSFASPENVNGLHRILLGRSIPEELNFYNLNSPNGNKKISSSSQPILEILLDKVLNSFLNYSEKQIETYQYIQLGIELLKFYKKIIPFFNLDLAKLTKTFEKVEKVMSALKTKKAYENLVIKHLEKIIFNLIILNNDHILYSKICLEDNNSKEIVKESKFSFQKSEFNKKMILTLFSYSLDATDNTDYLLNKQIYDILVNEYDYYVENLENIVNSKFVELLNHENFQNILKIDYKSESKNDLNEINSYNLKNYFVTNQEEETKKVLLMKNENLEKLFENYLGVPGINEEILIKNLSTDLKDYKLVIEEFLGVNQNINKNVNVGMNIYNSENNNSEKEKNLNLQNVNVQLETEKNLNLNTEENKFSSFRKKMGLFKIGCFDVLFNFCKFFNLEIYFTQPIFTEKIREILNLIFEIFDLFSADNPFISSLFFNKSIIAVLFKNEYLFRENIKFYLKKLKILSKADYKINTEFLIEKILEQTNFEEYTTIDIESKETILKIFVILLKITNGKSLMIINDRISSEIIKILYSDDFLKEINDFLLELQKTKRPEISNNNYLSNFSQSDPESGKGKISNLSKNNSKGGFLTGLLKKKTIFSKSDISSNDTLKNPLQYIEIIKLTYTCVNLLAPEYFYLVAESLQISKISEILQNFKNLEPDKRRIFTLTYFRFYAESYFKIHIEISKELLDSYLEEIDVNIINMDFKKNQKFQNLQNTIQEEQHELNLLNDISDVEYNPEEEIENSLKGMEPILRNLEKFRSVFMSQSDFFKKVKLNLKYFEDVIFFPTLYSIYKICYFEKEVSAKFKYTVYRLIFLFMQCFKFHCENLKNLDFTVKENHEKFVKYFYISTRFKENYENVQQNMKRTSIIQKPNEIIQNEENQKLNIEYIDKLITDLDNDILRMDSNNFEQLNLRNTLEIYFKFAANFVSYLKIISDNNPEKFEESNFNLTDPGKFLQNSSSLKNLNRVNSNSKNLHDSGSVKNLHGSGQGKNLNEKTSGQKENLMDGLKISLINTINNNNPKTSASQKITTLIEDYKTKKENYDEDNILNEIFSIDPDVDPYIQPVKETIALDLMKKLELPKSSNTLSLYNEQNTKFINSIIKLFKTDPTTWQKVIVDSASTSKYFFKSVISKQLCYLFQFITIEFNRLDTNFSSYQKKNFLSFLEFIRLLCEDHNKFFQTFLIHSKIFDDKDDEKDLYLINFLLKIPLMIITYVQYLVKKKDIRKFFKYDASFFTDVIEKITELLIEIMQGAFSFNFDRICQCKEFEDYYETHYKILDFLDTEQIFEIITSNFIKFLNCFIEENSNSQENKIDLVKKLNPGKLCDVMISSFKKLYISEIKSEEENLKNPQILSKIFKRNFHEELLQICLKKWEEISENPLFIITSGVFVYFKRISYYKGGINEKVKRILENLEKLSQTDFELIETENESTGKKNKQPWLEIVKSELFLFLNKMVKEVEICYRQDELIEDSELKRYKSFFDHDHDTLDILTSISEKKSEEIVGIDKVIFLVHPNSLFIKKKDYYNFISEAPLDNFNSKLNFALEYFPEIMNILQMRKMLNNLNSGLLRKLYELDYNNLEILCVVISTITNGLMFLSIQYKVNDSEFPNVMKNMEENVNEEVFMPERSPYEIIDPYMPLSYSITIFHICLLGLIILNWFTFAILKHVKYNTEKMNFFYRIFLYLSFIFNSEIFPFIWNFTFNLIPILNSNLKFLAALQLFNIFNIFPTMSSVLFAVRIRYKQFASTGFLLCILILFYSSIIFYFYRDELYNDDIQENICGTFLQCFMHISNYGIRAGDGVSFEIKTLNMSGYWSEFIFNWVFYFSIMLIMINIINGIIVDTFQALREQNNERDDAMVNVCYICSLNRQKFEIKGLSFDEHVEREHYVLNYFEYFSKIIMTDEHDLNSMDFQVLNAINQGRTDFFPIKKAKCLEKN